MEKDQYDPLRDETQDAPESPSPVLKKATEKDLDDLHGTLSRQLKHEITTRHYDVKTGKRVHCPAAYLNVARQFLKDMGIEVDLDSYKNEKDFLQPDDLDGLDDNETHYHA